MPWIKPDLQLTGSAAQDRKATDDAWAGRQLFRHVDSVVQDRLAMKSLSTGFPRYPRPCRGSHSDLSVRSRNVAASVESRVEARRSQRRTRTVTAYRDGDTLVVVIPARLSKAEEAHWVAEMQRKLLKGEPRKLPSAKRSDETLLRRCAELSARHLRGRAVPKSVRWVAPMRTRWASCTPADG